MNSKCLRCDGFIKPKQSFSQMECWLDAEYYCENCGAIYKIIDDSEN